MSAVAAPAGTNILVLDRADKSVIRIPVVAFEVLGSLAYPIAAVAFGGLLKGVRALEMNDLITDRGFEVPFDSQEAWVMWASSVTPGAESEAFRHTDGATDEPEGDLAELEAKREAVTVRASVNETTGPATTRIPPRAEKPRKTFASKSFWSRTNMLGVLEVVEIETGEGLPRETEGFEKIKRDDYAGYKKQAKGGDETVLVIGWDNGPVIPGESDEIIEEVMEADDDDTFDSGLV